MDDYNLMQILLLIITVFILAPVFGIFIFKIILYSVNYAINFFHKIFKHDNKR